jgi:asparagine synthase (glutamine-hydrolysing)
MCGITGLITSRNVDVDRSLLQRMNDLQSHRGPNGDGLHMETGVGLAHRRLSIIDLEGGHQPLYNEDSTVVTVFNGEIYNFQDVTIELERLGHKFHTRSDTEVIVHAWEEWGTESVLRFNGMFAFAVWDRNKQMLFLARDRLGVKPLYYAVLGGDTLVFASELKSIMAHPRFSKEIDASAVSDYCCYGYVPEPKTIYKAARKLEPGHTITIDRRTFEIKDRCYWDVSFITEKAPADVEGELIERFRAAVKRRLIAEVPLGAFLSGGVDSSAVVAMMAGLQSDPVNTCSISFGDLAYNEATYAKAIAERYHTNHRVEVVESDQFDLVDTLVALYDEPFADSSAIPTYRVCELASRSVTVALSGDGGDESFAGYRRYRWHAYEQRVRGAVPQFLRGPLFGTLGRVYPKMDWAPKPLRARTTFQALAKPALEGYLDSVSILTGDLRRSLFSKGFNDELQGYDPIEVLRRHSAAAQVEDPLSHVQYLDLKTYLPGDILTKVDRASMAHGLEVRVPILDYTFIEWVAKLPPQLKLAGREGKHIFKRALKPYLSDDILYRPKMGFAVPLKSWFRGPLRQKVRDRLLAGPLLDTGIFDEQVVHRLVDQHETGQRDNSAPIWALLMFAGFCAQGLESNRPVGARPVPARAAGSQA